MTDEIVFWLTAINIVISVVMFIRVFVVGEASRKAIREVFGREDWLRCKERLHVMNMSALFNLTKWRYRDFYPEGWLDD